MKNEEIHIAIIQYLQGELSEEASKELFDALEKDPALKKEFLVEKELMESFHEGSWNSTASISLEKKEALLKIMQSERGQNIKKAIQTASERNRFKRKKPKRIPRFALGLAASIALLIGVFVFTPEKTFDPAATYASYYDKTSLPDLQNRSESGNSLTEKGIQFYEEKDYSKAIEFFSQIPPAELKMASKVYLAFSYAENLQYAEAIRVLNAISTKDHLDAEKKHWYLALIYVKSNQLEKAKTSLQHIIKTNGFQVEKAKKLLKELP